MIGENKPAIPYGAVVCINGHKRSGKDTFATMLQFLVAKDALGDDMVDEEKFLTDLENDVERPEFQGHFYTVRKSFADKLYNMVAQLTGADITFLRNHKDDVYYQPLTGRIVYQTDEDFGAFTKHDKEAKDGEYELSDIITLRVLLKDISENGVKLKFPKIFINAIKNDIKMMDFSDRLPWIIPDMRTEDEYLSMRQDGFFIQLNRPETSHLKDGIDSELEDMPFDVKIDNNKDIRFLYDRAKDVYTQIKKRYGAKSM